MNGFFVGSLIFCVVGISFLPGVAFCSPLVLGLGSLSNDNFESRALGVSRNGRFVVGQSNGSVSNQAFIWSFSQGMSGIPSIDARVSSSAAYDVSLDGKRVVGIDRDLSGASGLEGFFWEADVGTKALGQVVGPRFSGGAIAASSEVDVVAGFSFDSGNAVRWSLDAGLQELDSLSGPPFNSQAYASSGDGRVMGGYSSNIDSDNVPVVWDSAGRVNEVPSVGGFLVGSVFGISADGSMAVGGFFDDTGESSAFRWSESLGTELLTSAGGVGVPGIAYAASRDGSRVVGTIRSPGSSGAAVWEDGSGFVRIEDWLFNGFGASITSFGFSSLDEAHDVSDSGEVIVGVGTNLAGDREGFVLYTTGVALGVDGPSPLVLIFLGVFHIVFRMRRDF